MEFFTGAVVGGLIYDALKVGTLESIEYVKLALKKSLLSDDEKLLIALDLSQATPEDKSSKESMQTYFEENAPNTKEIIDKYKQTNISHSGPGDVVMGDKKTKTTHSGSGHIIQGDHIGRDKVEVAGDHYKGGKHEHHHYPKIDPKKP